MGETGYFNSRFLSFYLQSLAIESQVWSWILLLLDSVYIWIAVIWSIAVKQYNRSQWFSLQVFTDWSLVNKWIQIFFLGSPYNGVQCPLASKYWSRTRSTKHWTPLDSPPQLPSDYFYFRKSWRSSSWWCSPQRCAPRSSLWASCFTREATWEIPGTSWTSLLWPLGEYGYLVLTFRL